MCVVPSQYTLFCVYVILFSELTSSLFTYFASFVVDAVAGTAVLFCCSLFSEIFRYTTIFFYNYFFYLVLFLLR